MKILFVNHDQERCGVYQYGKRLADIVYTDPRWDLSYLSCNTEAEFRGRMDYYQPDILIVNWHPSTLGWWTPILAASISQPKYYVHHEGEYPHHMSPAGFFSSDGVTNTILRVYGLVRPLFHPDGLTDVKNDIPTIGSFGFGFGNKGFENVVETVCEQYDEAVINIQMSFPYFGDSEGVYGRTLADRCRQLVTNSNIKLNITHDFISDHDLLQFLNNNDVNIFMYHDMPGRGLASTIDYVASLNKPFGINSSNMFRHVLFPEINVEHNSIADIIDAGSKPARTLQKLWSYENLNDSIAEVIL